MVSPCNGKDGRARARINNFETIFQLLSSFLWFSQSGFEIGISTNFFVISTNKGTGSESDLRDLTDFSKDALLEDGQLGTRDTTNVFTASSMNVFTLF